MPISKSIVTTIRYECDKCGISETVVEGNGIPMVNGFDQYKGRVMCLTCSATLLAKKYENTTWIVDGGRTLQIGKIEVVDPNTKTARALLTAVIPHLKGGEPIHFDRVMMWDIIREWGTTKTWMPKSN